TTRHVEKEDLDPDVIPGIIDETITEVMPELIERVDYSGVLYVATFTDLPATAPEGKIAIVLDENRMYTFINGTWTPDIYTNVEMGSLDATRFADWIEPITLVPSNESLPIDK